MINDSSPMRGHPLVVAYLRSDSSSIYTDVLQPYLKQKGIPYEQYAPASLELGTDLSKWPLFMRFMGMPQIKVTSVYFRQSSRLDKYM
ncbi:hypothetical protein PACILC2_49690 [Paenibacillus cisolokensis]|uniref:Uncharacterized protein n=1 Tax=Paenibacillus cisolokensis TaxID=1658519 RepID=A0ABQ4NDW4_9BACL|nr:hypothetical protein [Paenibacillus cisolokensis]GIQ66401.1 hypothetical protein PACILC2_49690 [Paenibacillus cisolokensis]